MMLLSSLVSGKISLAATGPAGRAICFVLFCFVCNTVMRAFFCLFVRALTLCPSFLSSLCFFALSFCVSLFRVAVCLVLGLNYFPCSSYIPFLYVHLTLPYLFGTSEPLLVIATAVIRDLSCLVMASALLLLHVFFCVSVLSISRTAAVRKAWQMVS